MKGEGRELLGPKSLEASGFSTPLTSLVQRIAAIFKWAFVFPVFAPDTSLA